MKQNENKEQNDSNLLEELKIGPDGYPIRVLFVDDNEDNYTMVHDLLSESQEKKFHLEWIDTFDAALRTMERTQHDVYLVDYSLDKHNGLKLLGEAIANGCKSPIILLFKQKDHKLSVKAMKSGVTDYLIKEQINAPLLERSICYAIEHSRMLQKLRENKESYTLIARSLNDGLWDWNLKTNEIYFSPRWKSMLGYKESEIENSPDEWFNRIHPEDIEQVQEEIDVHLEGLTPHFQNEHRMLHKDGNYRWVLSRGILKKDESGNPSRMVGTQADITERKTTEAQLRQQAFYDGLTGLPNRAVFTDRLGRSIERSKRRGDYLFAVLFLDLDDFKTINDSLGHMAGDQLLIAVARRLKPCLRSADTVARFGGDEFAILLDDIKDVSDAMRVANRIQRELSSPFNLSGQEVFTSASIGIALSTNGYDRPDEILRDADTAMYDAKIQGKAQHQIFDKGMHDQAVKRLQLENDLRRAIENHEFRVYYQPIVSIKTGRIAGFEALVRWQHPDKGLISPVNFLAVAEETGLIIPIDQIVLREACAQMHVLRERFPKKPSLFISVNFSKKQLIQPDLIEQIRQVLQETDLDYQSLRPEITEREIVEDFESASSILSQLKELDILLHMDDFGTGYSSLSYLIRLNIDTLKIDGSFVDNIDVRSENFEIVRTILTLAHNLGMDVIAEGVETAEQYAQLKTLKCEYAQGYFFSRPLPGEKIESLLETNPQW